LRGYQARRISLKAKSDLKVEKLYEEYHRIDLIVRNNF